MTQLFNRLPGSLNARLALGLVVAVLLPSVVMLILTFVQMNTFTIESYKNYLVETGQRRQAVIISEFDAAFNSLDEFTTQPVTYQLLYNALVFRSTTSSTGATNRLATLLNAPGQERFESAWLLNRAGTAIASSTQTDKILPFNNTDRSTSVSYAEAEQMAQEGTLYKVVVEATNDPNEASILVISVLRDTGLRPIGYLVAQMSTDSLFYRHFQNTNNGLDVHGYVVLPSRNAYLASDHTRDSNNILGTSQVLRALDGETGRLEELEIQEGSETKEVIWYTQRLMITNTPFVLISEMHADDIVQQINGYFQVAGFALMVGGLVLAIVLLALFSRLISFPLQELNAALRAMGRGIVDAPLETTKRQDEFGEMARLLLDVRRQTSQANLSLTQRLRERERDVRVTQSIIQALAGERDLQSLTNRVVALIVENFPMIYHAQIFLTDTENYAVLRASTGEVGQQLMSRGHRLAIGSVSVIGQAVQQRQNILARDTSSSELHRRNEFLPDTRAELAIPLIVNQDVIGALDLQSKERDVFTEDMISVMQALAAQISIALENVRLYEDSRHRISQSHLEQRVDVRREWKSYLQTYRRRRLSERAGNLTGYDFTSLRAAALKKEGAVVGEITPRGTIPFVVLIKLRNQVLGALEFELPQVDFHYDKVLLAEELSNRLAVSLDNARLFQESRKSVERERTVNMISAQLTSKTDVNEILQMAIQEVGIALRSSQVSIQLRRPTSPAEPAAPTEIEVSPTPTPLLGNNGHSHGN